MSELLRISKDLTLPIDFVTEKAAVLARTGAGKSYAAAVVAEELLKAKQQVVILDLTDAWWGLRSSADGKKAGFPIYVFGGDHADLPLQPTAGALMADLIAGENISVVLSLAGFDSNAEEHRFVTDFCDRLYRKNRKPLHFFLDEGDNFAPQQPEKDQAVMLGRVKRIFQRGRIRGIGGTIISQRAAVVNKSVLSQAGILLALQTTDVRDRKAIADWSGDKNVSKEQLDELLGSLASLPNGTGFFWWPAREIFKKIKIRLKETFDSGRTPKPGETRVEPKQLADVDLEKLKARMASTVEKAKQDDPRQLRKQIAELQRQVASKGKAPAPAAAAPKIVEKPVRVEVPIITDKQLQRFEQALTGLKKFADQVTIAAKEISTAIANRPRAAPTIAPRRGPVQPVLPARPAVTPPRASGTTALKPLPADWTFGGSERRILRILAYFGGQPIPKEQLGVLSVFSSSGGSFSKYVSTLKSAGFCIDGQEGGTILATPHGIAAVKDDPLASLPTIDELVEAWKKSPAIGGSEGRMFDALVTAGGEGLTKEELGEKVNFEPTGGSFWRYLSTLRGLNLATQRDGRIFASEFLFSNEGAIS